MHTISIPELMLFVDNVAVKLREPVMIWGQPGVGKSEAIHQLAQKHDALMCDVRLSQYDSVDLRGIPDVDKATHLTVWNAPSTLPFKGNPRFDDKVALIFLFLDEINSAQPSVAAVAYQLINDRRVGEHELMDNVVVIAAGNRDGDRGVTNRMPTPLANRFTHVEVGVSVDAWCEWATAKGLPAIGVAFLQFRKPLLSTFDPAKADKAFATPRTWYKALKYYSTAMPEQTRQAAMAGAVGDGPAAEFWGFVDVWQKMIPMSELIKNPLKVAIPEEAAMLYAVTVAVSGSMSMATIAPLHQFLLRLAPEFCVLAWQLALKRDTSLETSREFLDFAKKYKAVFRS